MHVLRNKRHLWSLRELHSRVPADKAAHNVIIVCRKYYLQVVLKEIDSTATYESIMEEHQGIVDKHIKYFNKHCIDVLLHYRCLPQFYWLPKLHKQPYGTRFIAAITSNLPSFVVIMLICYSDL